MCTAFLGRETEKRKEYLAVSPGACSFPAAVQLICPFQRGALLGVDILPLPSTFLKYLPYLSTSFTRLTQHTWRQVQALFLPSLPSPLLGKSYISTEKECTHPVLIRPGKREESGRAESMEAPHISPAEQNRTEEAGGQACRGVLYGSCS